ncbi:adenosylcobinamide-GDP ribazoletransferase [Cellulosilyticum ruminicola]|uniref:adenosylcobinamide-GDP ribazoletransferase n=1 Tax=Cellulosilyticum ruminicola TaxID=425254 RepID=UPI0006D1269B|nr:adenosylcobinamide-GDP ribazoletransferase [Cellulosilyticum ruminicola]
MKKFIGIVQFLTRMPINMDIGFIEDFHESTRYFPLVGLILGIIYYVIGYIGEMCFNNNFIVATLILVGTAMLTGGLHLDGLGDTFDGLYSYRDKERILEIMKDSRVGTNALLSVVFVLLLKLGFLMELLNQNKLWVVIIMPVIARTMQVLSCYHGKTPRAHGMGNIFIGKVSNTSLGIALSTTIVITLGVLWLFESFSLNVVIETTVLIGIVIVILKLFERSVYRKIDGITGDVLGCICELTELGVCIAMYFL